VVPFHRVVVEVAPFRLEVAAEGHQSQAEEGRHPTRHRVEGKRLCFSVVVRAQAVVLAVFPGATEYRLGQVDREGRTRAHSRRTSGRSVGYSLLQEGTGH
jgi:hypothetical protein